MRIHRLASMSIRLPTTPAIYQNVRPGTEGLGFVLLGLFGEVGGLLSALKKKQRDKDAFVRLPRCRARRAGDALWYFANATLGAYGGMAAIVPEMRHVLDGCQGADSIVVNPHKWLFTPLDCSTLYVRDPDALQRSFSLVPEYLKSREEDVTNYMDWGTWLGRRFRALKLWMVIRHFGHDGLAARIRRHIELAQDLVQRIDADPDIEALAPAPFSTVCFRFRPSELKGVSGDARRRQACDEYLDRLNEAVLDAVNASGEAFLSHTKIRERYAI